MKNMTKIISAEDDFHQSFHCRAMNLLESTASQCEALAQRMSGLLYSGGFDVPQDKEKAKYWYALAANQGDSLAAEELKRLSKKKRFSKWFS